MIEIGLAGYGVFKSGRENGEIETDERQRGVEDLQPNDWMPGSKHGVHILTIESSIWLLGA